MCCHGVRYNGPVTCMVTHANKYASIRSPSCYPQNFNLPILFIHLFRPPPSIHFPQLTFHHVNGARSTWDSGDNSACGEQFPPFHNLIPSRRRRGRRGTGVGLWYWLAHPSRLWASNSALWPGSRFWNRHRLRPGLRSTLRQGPSSGAIHQFLFSSGKLSRCLCHSNPRNTQTSHPSKASVTVFRRLTMPSGLPPGSA